MSFGPSCLAVGPTAQSEKGWELIQEHVIQKRTGVTVTPIGIRINALKSTWSVVSQAPNWDAVIYCRADRTICRVPYAKWSKSGFSLPATTDELTVIPTSPSFRTGTIQIGSSKVPVTFMRWQGPAPALGDMMFQSKGKPTECVFTIISSKMFDAPVQVRQLLRQIYDMPSCDGIPLGFSASSEQRPLLATFEVKSIQLPPELFDLPTGFKTVKTEMEVWVNAEDKDKINDFGELLGAPGK